MKAAFCKTSEATGDLTSLWQRNKTHEPNRVFFSFSFFFSLFYPSNDTGESIANQLQKKRNNYNTPKRTGISCLKVEFQNKDTTHWPQKPISCFLLTHSGWWCKIKETEMTLKMKILRLLKNKKYEAHAFNSVSKTTCAPRKYIFLVKILSLVTIWYNNYIATTGLRIFVRL